MRKITVLVSLILPLQLFSTTYFGNPDNYLMHYRTTGPEIWRDTEGSVTHFVSAMGTTGTIMGTSKYLKEQSPNVQIVGTQPKEGSRIPGIRRWSPEFLPKIFDPSRVDRIIDVKGAPLRGNPIAKILCSENPLVPATQILDLK